MSVLFSKGWKELAMHERGIEKEIAYLINKKDIWAGI